MRDLSQQLLEILESTLPKGEKRPISLHEPRFSGNEWNFVKECIDTGWVSSVGKYVDRFEAQLVEQTNIPYVVAVGNGTSALHLALLLANVKPQDEVLIPSLTFVATANAVRHAFAEPHLIESEEATLGIDPDKLQLYLRSIVEVRSGTSFNKKTGRRISAIIPMHTFGHACRIDRILEIANEFHLQVVEDAAESLGSSYQSKPLGGFGLVAAMSFNGNKTVTTGGGGAILTRDEKIAKRAKHLSTTAKVPHKWEFVHDEVGYNYRLPNINAALGCAQLEQLPRYLRQKRALAEKYRQAFSKISGLRFFTEPKNCISNYWLNAILIDSPDLQIRDSILTATNAAGFMTRPTWTLMHRLEMYKNCPKMDLAVSENLEKRIINLPSSPFLCPEVE